MFSKISIRIVVALIMLANYSMPSLAQNPLSNKGFVKLFNGKNFDGWYLKIRTGDSVLAKKVYAIENKMVHVFNKEFKDTTELNTGKNPTHGLFYTNNKYSQYIFRFEYKWGKRIANNFAQFQYDAGMYYHVVDDKIWPKGVEYQVRYNHITNQNHTGDFWANKIQWYSKDSLTFTLPSEGGMPMPFKGGEHRASKNAEFNGLNDKWNKCEVIVMGNKYTIHKLNGKIVNMAINLPFGEGKIGLQSETAEIFYRNIQIKELKEFIPMEVFLK
jgi:Domain of Unknown Function (DUF1080)